MCNIDRHRIFPGAQGLRSSSGPLLGSDLDHAGTKKTQRCQILRTSSFLGASPMPDMFCHLPGAEAQLAEILL